MSTLLFPRIYFKGRMSFDPTLANNFREIYDADKVLLNIPSGETLPSLKTKLPLVLDRSWNHFGTHHARFEQVSISSVSTGIGVHDEKDALVKAEVALDGKLVDINPIIDNGTQVFF